AIVIIIRVEKIGWGSHSRRTMSLNTKAFSVATAVVCFSLFVPYADANSMITDPGQGIVATSGADQTVGFQFTDGGPNLEVTALGVWDQNGDGLLNSHFVGIWDINGNLLGQVLVAAGTTDPLIGEFRYATLTQPILLNCGFQYVIGANYPGVGADPFRV